MGKSVIPLVRVFKGHLRSHVVEIAVLTIVVLVLVIPLIIFYFPRSTSFQVGIHYYLFMTQLIFFKN